VAEVLTRKEMQAADEFTIKKVGVPSLVLMERAALAIADEAASLLEGALGVVTVACGTGNNAGDGAACARILALRGNKVYICCAGDEKKRSEEFKSQLEWAFAAGVEEADFEILQESDVIVDALFGIGLKRAPQGEFAELIQIINMSRAKVVSADIPSGIDADTGMVLGCAVRADVTVTMQYAKLGCLIGDGAVKTGRLVIADIGIFPVENDVNVAEAMDDLELEWYMPFREEGGNKGTYGKVLVIAGSKDMAGASYLTARAALSVGAGMVKVIAPECNRVILQTLLPEAILSTYGSDEEAVAAVREALPWADSVACGPGLGKNPLTKAILKALFENENIRLVLDADALNVLAEEPDLMAKLPKDCVLTPHLVELSRLSGLAVDALKADPRRTAEKFADKHRCVLVRKDARTMVVDAWGRCYISTFGNDGMATAGSGDVLTGVIASYAAQEEAATMLGAAIGGVLLHGKGGDKAAEEKGGISMTARDIIGGMEKVLREIEPDVDMLSKAVRLINLHLADRR